MIHERQNWLGLLLVTGAFLAVVPVVDWFCGRFVWANLSLVGRHAAFSTIGESDSEEKDRMYLEVRGCK